MMCQIACLTLKIYKKDILTLFRFQFFTQVCTPPCPTSLVLLSLSVSVSSLSWHLGSCSAVFGVRLTVVGVCLAVVGVRLALSSLSVRLCLLCFLSPATQDKTRQTHRQTHRQTDKANRQADRRTGRQTDRQTGRQNGESDKLGTFDQVPSQSELQDYQHKFAWLSLLPPSVAKDGINSLVTFQYIEIFLMTWPQS